jgi:hypothetical protein
MIDNLGAIIGSSVGILIILIGATTLYIYRQWSDKQGIFKESESDLISIPMIQRANVLK